MEPPPPVGEVRDLWLEGTAALRDGNPSDAVGYYSRALELRPTDCRLLCNRSVALLHLGNSEAALADAEKCIRSNPVWVKGYVRAAMALRFQGKHTLALAYLTQGETSNPGNTELATLRSCTEAEDLFNHVMAKVDSPRSPSKSPAGDRHAQGYPPSHSPVPKLPSLDPHESPARTPGAHKVQCEDGTSFTTYFTAPSLDRRGSVPATPLPLTASPPLKVRSPSPTHSYPAPPSPVAFPVHVPAPTATKPGVLRILFALVLASVPWLVIPGGCPPSFHTLMWVLLTSANALWSALIPAVIPTPKVPVPTSLGAVIPVVVLAAATAVARLVSGEEGLETVLQVFEVQKCPLIVVSIAAVHIAVTAYASDCLKACAYLDVSEVAPVAASLSKWMVPGLVCHIGLAASQVYHWCSAIRVAPSVDSALVLPASAGLLLSALSLGLIGVGLRQADQAIALTYKEPQTVSPLGLPPREWIWLTLTGMLVAAFVATKKDEPCVCNNSAAQRWFAFGF